MTRVGIVMGAGGTTGIAWLLGVLEAIERGTGWAPATADVVTGTSAGAVAAAVLTSGVDAERLLEMAEDPAVLDAAIAAATEGRGRRTTRGPGWPGSLALGVTGLLATDPRHRLTSLSGFLPRGSRTGDDIRGLTHEAVRGGWPERTSLLLHACDLHTGRRVSFGAPDAPSASLADAVVASCAVPGYYRPVSIGGREYIDGGLASFTNADAVATAGCDVVLCLSPFSSSRRGSLADTALYGGLRRALAWGVRREADRLRAGGARVVVIEPAEPELRAMGLNVMARSGSRAVLEAASASVGERLEGLLAGVELPPAAPLRAAA